MSTITAADDADDAVSGPPRSKRPSTSSEQTARVDKPPPAPPLLVNAVPFQLAEPSSSARSIFDVLKAALRQVDDPRSSAYKQRKRAAPPPANERVFVQEKFDGHRQLVSVTADGVISVHGKEQAELETVGASFLEDLAAELAALPQPCLLDAELVGWDEAGTVSLDLVKPSRGGRHRRWALVVFDITCAQVATADYETRHALLEGVLGMTAGPLTDAARVTLERHVMVAPLLATWTPTTPPEECAALGRMAIEAGLEGLVLRGAQQPWTTRPPGSASRAPAYVGIKLKPDHLTRSMCTLLAVGVSNQWKLILWMQGAARIAGKADLLVSANDVNHTLWHSNEFAHTFLDGAWTPPGAAEPGPPSGVGTAPRVWFKRPFAVNVLCDWRLVSAGLKFGRVTGLGTETDVVPTSFVGLAAQLKERALAAFTALPRPPTLTYASGRSPQEVAARRERFLRDRAPLPRLADLTLDQLKQIAEERQLTKGGTKAVLIRRLFESRWPVLRVMLDEAGGSTTYERTEALASVLGVVPDDRESLVWALMRQRGGSFVDWEGDDNGPPDVLVTDAVDPAGVRDSWGLGPETKLVPFTWLQSWVQQDIDLPDTYADATALAAAVSPPAPPRPPPARRAPKLTLNDLIAQERAHHS